MITFEEALKAAENVDLPSLHGFANSLAIGKYAIQFTAHSTSCSEASRFYGEEQFAAPDDLIEGPLQELLYAGYSQLDATQLKQIRRDCALRYHPDRWPPELSSLATAQMQLINRYLDEALARLSDQMKMPPS